MVTLVAMSRAGETVITRDPAHGLWLHLPEGAGRSRSINQATVDRAVRDHAFVEINEEFSTWEELEDARQAHVAEVIPGVVVDRESLSAEDAVEMFEVADDWVADGQGGLARRLATELLRVPAVVQDIDLRERVIVLLERLNGAAGPTPLLREPDDAQMAEARRRWQSSPLAA